MSELCEAIECVQMTEGFSDVLTDEQLDDVYCAALKLSAAVTEYMANSIEYLLGIFDSILFV